MSFGKVWGLLVDDEFDPGLPPAEPFPLPVHTGDVRVDVQSALAQLAPIWGFKPLLDIEAEQARDELARASVMALSFVAQSARGQGPPMVPQRAGRRGHDHRRAVHDPLARRARPARTSRRSTPTGSAAEHGMNASTFTARVIASTGADVPPACPARSARCPVRCTAVPRPGCCRWSRGSRRAATPRGLRQGRPRPQASG